MFPLVCPNLHFDMPDRNNATTSVTPFDVVLGRYTQTNGRITEALMVERVQPSLVTAMLEGK